MRHRLFAAAMAVLTAVTRRRCRRGGRLGAGVAQAAAPAGAPDFGANVKIFDPSMPTARSRPSRRCDLAKQVDNEMGTAAVFAAVQARHVRHSGSPAEIPGRLLHRGRRAGQEPDRRHDQRQCRRLQPLPSRSDNCIALNNFWRSLSNLTVNVAGGTTDCRKTRHVLGGVAGLARCAG